MRTICYLLAALAAATLAPTPAHAATPDTTAVVTDREYQRAQWGDCRSTVERRFDTEGYPVFLGTTYWTRRYPTGNHRDEVAVVYQHTGGCWRLIEKRRDGW